MKDLSSPLEGKSWWVGKEKEEEEGEDKNKRPRMVLSEALLFPRLDQGGKVSDEGVSVVGTLNNVM